ncbi:MAG: molybdate ABC transporter substrate-binding protein [Candidatus Omnitrophica bacterium]|jgi:molybdate transport system substrate-binding protein|nr:molybdate ABC transporter substrate-binding protein [Candidatus Omnitrophota bacterium]
MRLKFFIITGILFSILFNPALVRAENLRIFAADALPKPIEEIGHLFEKSHPGITIYYSFLGSGILKGDIQQGAPCDIFLCANRKFQRQLKKTGFINNYKIFAYDYLALATPFNNPGNVNYANMIQKLMDKNISLTTSTPHADPAGDYTWKMFKLINKKYPGAFKKIVSHANHLLDAALIIPVLVNNDTDIGILYTSQILEVERQGTKLNMIPIPAKYNTKAKFTASILKTSKHKKIAKQFINFLFSPKGKQILKFWGFTPVK